METGRVRFEWRHLAILGDLSEDAAQASECAAQQDHFWEYHDRLFEVWTPDIFSNSGLKGVAEEIGLNSRGFDKCLDQGRMQKYVDEDGRAAEDAGINSTPTTIIDGRVIRGNQDYEVFERAIEEALARARS